MMDLASSASCALKQEVLASDSYVGQNYGTSLLAEIPGIPLNPTEWNDEDAQRWLHGCINGYELCEEDLPPSLDVHVDNLLKGVNSVEFEKAFGDVCGDVIANDFSLRVQMAEQRGRSTVGVCPPTCQPISTTAHPPTCQPIPTTAPVQSRNTGHPQPPPLPNALATHRRQTVMPTFQPEPIHCSQFYPQLTAYQPQPQPQPTTLYENHIINSSSLALGYPKTSLPPMDAFREQVTMHNSSKSPADSKVFSFPSQFIVPEQMSPGLPLPGLSSKRNDVFSLRPANLPIHFNVPLNHTQRSGSLMSVSSVESNSVSDWTSEEEVSPFVCSDPDDSLTTRSNQLLDGSMMNGAIPTITLSPQSTGQQFGQPLGQFPDGTGIVAIPINPKTGKPKRKRRKKIRGQIIPPPLLPNRSSCTLWEFFLELLCDPEHYSRLITWLDRDKGEFKIIDSEVVSIIWGLLKNKTGMKYDHMSRSIRYYYGKDILDKVQDKQLVYRFGAGSNWLNYQPKSQGVDESRMPKTPIQICGRVAKPKHFAVARVTPSVAPTVS